MFNFQFYYQGYIVLDHGQLQLEDELVSVIKQLKNKTKINTEHVCFSLFKT